MVDWTSGRTDRRSYQLYPADLETIWIAHDDMPGWWLSVQFTHDGRTAGFTVSAAVDRNLPYPKDELPRSIPDGGLTARVMRRVRWAEVENAARQWIKQLRGSELSRAGSGWIGDDGTFSPMIEGGGMEGELFKLVHDRFASAYDEPERTRPGPVPMSDRKLAVIADDYVEALADVRTMHSPVKAVAEKHYLNASTIRGRIAECRSRGLLTEAPAGKAGGELTPHAINLLRGES